MTPDEAHALIREHCRSKDGATEDYPWDDVVWKIGGKIFAATGEGSPQVSVKATLEEQAQLIEHPAIAKASYVGRFGWVVIEVTDKQTASLALELIDRSFESVRAGRKRSV